MDNSREAPNNLPIQFTALLLHDLEAPLAVAKQFINRVKEGRHDPQNPRHQKFAVSAQHALERGERILEDLIDQARNLESGLKINRTPTILSNVITNCVDIVMLLAEDKNLTIQAAPNAALQEAVLLDSRLLSRVIDNLLVNAIRHAARGSRIDVNGGRIAAQLWIEIANQSEGDVEIDIDKIFDPLYQVQMRSQQKMRGSGLGLTFSQEVVVAHGGTIAAREEKGATIFRIELPAERRGDQHG